MPIAIRRSRLSSDMSILRRRANQTTRRRPSTPHGVAVTHHQRAGDAGRRAPWSPLFVAQPSSNGRYAQAVRKSVEDGGQESQYGAIIACWHRHVKARAASLIRCMGQEAEHTANHDF